MHAAKLFHAGSFVPSAWEFCPSYICGTSATVAAPSADEVLQEVYVRSTRRSLSNKSRGGVAAHERRKHLFGKFDLHLDLAGSNEFGERAGLQRMKPFEECVAGETS